MKLIAKTSITFDHILNVSAVISAALIGFAMLSVTTDVISRYIFNHSIVGVFELTEYTLLYMTFLCAARVLKDDAHVKMDIVLQRLNPRVNALLNFLTSIVGGLISLGIIYYGIQVTWDFLQKGSYELTMLEPPSALIVGVIPIGGLLLFIQFIRRIYGYLQIWRTTRY